MRAWLEISLENIRYNYKKIAEMTAKELIPVLKANAYGMGVLEVSRALYLEGARFFAVANIDEALEIKKNIKDAKILILGLLFHDELLIAEENNFIVTVSTIQELEYIKNNNLDLEIHFKIDTGMTRLGFYEEEFLAALKFCDENNIKYSGIFSHLSDADGQSKEAKIFTQNQFKRFKNILKDREEKFKYIHILNSAGIVNYNDIDFSNALRPGLALYGYMANKKVAYLKSAFTLKTRLLLKKEVKTDSSVSYGRKGFLKKGDFYGVLPIGYADGIKKNLKNSYVLINNIKCELIGEICMDMLMVKISKEAEEKISVGDEVIILNEKIIDDIDVEDFCLWEIMTSIGKRVKRIYLGDEDGKDCNG